MVVYRMVSTVTQVAPVQGICGFSMELARRIRSSIRSNTEVSANLQLGNMTAESERCLKMFGSSLFRNIGKICQEYFVSNLCVMRQVLNSRVKSLDRALDVKRLKNWDMF